jgi:hypothetical protein
MYNIRDEHKELVKQLNEKLKNEYGSFTENVPNYRIVWSDDQLEYRDVTDCPVSKFDAHGNKIGEITGVLLLPKYRQWLPHMWVLEKCVDVGELGNKELVASNYSYEPIFPFKDKDGEALPPLWDICWVVIASIHYHMGQEVKLYKDPDISPEQQMMRINKIMRDLFPNETATGDALAQQSGVGYTGPSKVELN